MVEVEVEVELRYLDHTRCIAHLAEHGLGGFLNGQFLTDDGERLEGHHVEIKTTAGHNHGIGQQVVVHPLGVAHQRQEGFVADIIEHTHVEKHLRIALLAQRGVEPDASAGGHAGESIDDLAVGFIGLGGAMVFHMPHHRVHVAFQLAHLVLVVAQDTDHELVALVAHLVLDASDDALYAFLFAGNGERIDVAFEQFALALIGAAGQGLVAFFDGFAEVGLLAQHHAQVAGLGLGHMLADKHVVAVAFAFALEEARAGSAGEDVAASSVAGLARVADAEV